MASTLSRKPEAGQADVVDNSHLGLPSQVPPLSRAAPESQSELWPKVPPPDEHAQPPAPDEYDQRGGTIDFAE